MKIKSQPAIILLCIIFILLPIANTNSASTWHFTDTVDDVEFFADDIKLSTGDYRNEIDVERVELNGNYIVIFTQSQPIDDQSHYYEVFVFWHDYPFKVLELNYTKVEFGEGTNHVYTQLYISSVEITDDNYDDIYIEGKAIWCPIPLFNHIDNTTAEQIEGDAYYYVNKAEGDYYYDQIRLGTITLGSPGFTFSITMISIVSIAVIYLVRKKR
ncbi:MAG: hypothetical protein FK733_17290 [Asgard group archaeon]|nr:hypothetical protein [Asgard group archaeon]